MARTHHIIDTLRYLIHRKLYLLFVPLTVSLAPEEGKQLQYAMQQQHLLPSTVSLASLEQSVNYLISKTLETFRGIFLC